MVVYQYLICFIRYRYPGAVPCRKGSLATGNPLIRKTYVSYDIMFRMFRRKPNPGIRIGIGVFGRGAVTVGKGPYPSMHVGIPIPNPRPRSSLAS